MSLLVRNLWTGRKHVNRWSMTDGSLLHFISALPTQDLHEAMGPHEVRFEMWAKNRTYENFDTNTETEDIKYRTRWQESIRREAKEYVERQFMPGLHQEILASIDRYSNEMQQLIAVDVTRIDPHMPIDCVEEKRYVGFTTGKLHLEYIIDLPALPTDPADPFVMVPELQ